MQDDMFEILEQAGQHPRAKFSDMREWRQSADVRHIARTFAKFVAWEMCGVVLSEQDLEKCVQRYFEITGR